MRVAADPFDGLRPRDDLMRHPLRHAAGVALCLLSVALARGAAAQRAQNTRGAFVPVTDQMLRNPDPADWLHWRRTFDSWGYSPLTQITRTNVSQLALVWTRPLGPGIQEGTPLVYRGVMYFPNPSDYVQALDARTGDLKWE